jgi:hypothetical protein
MTLLGTQIIELQIDWIKVNKNSERCGMKQAYLKGPHIFLNSGIHLKILGVSRCDMKEVPCRGHGNVTGHCTKFNCPEELNPGFFLEGLNKHMITTSNIIGSPKKYIYMSWKPP